MQDSKTTFVTVNLKKPHHVNDRALYSKTTFVTVNPLHYLIVFIISSDSKTTFVTVNLKKHTHYKQRTKIQKQPLLLLIGTLQQYIDTL